MRRKKPTSGNEYSICIDAGITLHTNVIAASLKEAIEKAMSRSVMTLCHQCSHGDPDTEWVTSGELDCDPSDCPIVSVICNGEDVTAEAQALYNTVR